MNVSEESLTILQPQTTTDSTIDSIAFHLTFLPDVKEYIMHAPEEALEETLTQSLTPHDPLPTTHYPLQKKSQPATISLVRTSSHILVYMFYSMMNSGSLAGKVNPALGHVINADLHRLQGQTIEQIIIDFTQNEVYTNLSLPPLTTTLEYAPDTAQQLVEQPTGTTW